MLWYTKRNENMNAYLIINKSEPKVISVKEKQLGGNDDALSKKYWKIEF